jgi:hypothetical protein
MIDQFQFTAAYFDYKWPLNDIIYDGLERELEFRPYIDKKNETYKRQVNNINSSYIYILLQKRSWINWDKYVCLLIELNFDFASIRVSNGSKGFLREINGSSASGRAEIHNFNHNAVTFAWFCHTLVCGSSAFDSIPSSTSCSIVPNGIACCSYHHTIVFIPVA